MHVERFGLLRVRAGVRAWAGFGFWGCGVRAELGVLLLDVRILLFTPWLVGLAVGQEEEDLPKKERRTGKG